MISNWLAGSPAAAPLQPSSQAPCQYIHFINQYLEWTAARRGQATAAGDGKFCPVAAPVLVSPAKNSRACAPTYDSVDRNWLRMLFDGGNFRPEPHRISGVGSAATEIHLTVLCGAIRLDWKRQA
jgi:hypothetical protein